MTASPANTPSKSTWSSMLGFSPSKAPEVPVPETIEISPSMATQPSSTKAFPVTTVATTETKASYEFSEEEEAKFSNISKAIGTARLLYLGHAALTFVSVTEKVIKTGPAELPGYFDVMDELNFAHFIGASKKFFLDVVLTKGNDLENLLKAISLQETFFQKLAPPLAIKSLILIVTFIAENKTAILDIKPVAVIKSLPGLIKKTPQLLCKVKGLPGFIKGKLGKKKWGAGSGPPNAAARLTAAAADSMDKTGVFWKI